MRPGTIGQVKGPFNAGENAFARLFQEEGTNSETMRIGVSIDEKDFLPFGNTSAYPNGFAFTITGTAGSDLIQMGRTCMYETDKAIRVNSLVFENDAPQSVIINFVIE